MNETAARHVTLVRALETAAPSDATWTAADAAWASRAAAEVVGEGADADRFLARRGQQGIEGQGGVAAGQNKAGRVGVVQRGAQPGDDVLRPGPGYVFDYVNGWIGHEEDETTDSTD